VLRFEFTSTVVSSSRPPLALIVGVLGRVWWWGGTISSALEVVGREGLGVFCRDGRVLGDPSALSSKCAVRFGDDMFQ
jgi:hypothetical protein